MAASVRSDRIIQRCPNCGRDLRIPSELIGQRVACKFCDFQLVAGLEEKPSEDQKIQFVGRTSAFMIEREWKAPLEKETRFTIIRHPLKQALRGYTLAVECYGPAPIHVAGIDAASGRPVALSKVPPGEVRLIPLDTVYRAYIWLDKGAKSTARLIISRNDRP